jgi:branched-chain amino acid transport system substrate-binding protein
MKKTGGKWPGTGEFMQIFAGLTLDSIRGPVSLDEQMNPVQNIYIRRVEKKQLFGYPEAELWNTVIKTYPNVGQYWTYGKEAFLAQPVYSRDFPPCGHCE